MPERKTDITVQEAWDGLEALKRFVSTPPNGFDDSGIVKSEVMFTPAAKTALGATLTGRFQENGLIRPTAHGDYLDLTALIRASRQGAAR